MTCCRLAYWKTVGTSNTAAGRGREAPLFNPLGIIVLISPSVELHVE